MIYLPLILLAAALSWALNQHVKRQEEKHKRAEDAAMIAALWEDIEEARNRGW